MHSELIDTLAIPNEKKIIYLIMDGLGGLPIPGHEETELEAAATPNLDKLAEKGTCGLLDPVGYGITPGSGPAHFALFGYDPVKYSIGRGILEAAGIDYPMTDKDLLIRINFATISRGGLITDRRAGRIDTETNKRICSKLRSNLKPANQNIEVIFEPVKEHRALLVLRGEGLRDEIMETDPQKTGLAPISPKSLIPEAIDTESALTDLVEKAREILADEDKANMLLLRGYAKYRRFPSLSERFGLKPLAIATYPMYRGIARLLGMTVHTEASSIEDEVDALTRNYSSFDFFFVHIKATDSRGEDGNYHEKIKVIEKVDSLVPHIVELKPDVLIVTGDHSTPAALAGHSWHPVPVLLSSATCRPDKVTRFGERDCIGGEIGRMPMVNLMALALAHAGRLEKFGA